MSAVNNTKVINTASAPVAVAELADIGSTINTATDAWDGCDWSGLKIAYTVVGCISFLCLLFTLYVFIITKEYKTVHDRVIMLNVIATMLVNIWFIYVINIQWLIDALNRGIRNNSTNTTLRLSSNSTVENGNFFYDHVGGDTWPNIIAGYCGYFSMLTMFAWMTVMCLDLSWTVFKVKRFHGSQRRKFIFYCVIGFGLPLMMASLAAICQV